MEISDEEVNARTLRAARWLQEDLGIELMEGFAWLLHTDEKALAMLEQYAGSVNSESLPPLTEKDYGKE